MNASTATIVVNVASNIAANVPVMMATTKLCRATLRLLVRQQTDARNSSSVRSPRLDMRRLLGCVRVCLFNVGF